MEIDAIHTVVAMHSSRNMPLHPPLSILPPLSSFSAAQPPRAAAEYTRHLLGIAHLRRLAFAREMVMMRPA